ncbi:MAG: BON domain-containing protein [Xanthomonadales bacterium]|nr:BON domain-containing protein [Xanthomonadales bacterium]
MTRTTHVMRPLATAALASVIAFGGSIALANDTTQPRDARDEGSEQPVTDTWITTKVKSSLLTSDGVSGTDISVSTENGVVTLEGEVDNQAEIDRAIAVARDIEGVVDVDSRTLAVRADRMTDQDRY